MRGPTARWPMRRAPAAPLGAASRGEVDRFAVLETARTCAGSPSTTMFWGGIGIEDDDIGDHSRLDRAELALQASPAHSSAAAGIHPVKPFAARLDRRPSSTPSQRLKPTHCGPFVSRFVVLICSGRTLGRLSVGSAGALDRREIPSGPRIARCGKEDPMTRPRQLGPASMRDRTAASKEDPEVGGGSCG
jgi:hypothetical protein